jgi:hypothetical protein
MEFQVPDEEAQIEEVDGETYDAPYCMIYDKRLYRRSHEQAAEANPDKPERTVYVINNDISWGYAERTT